jgi:NTP pyrophosphatase (non-canonical NTP hydrolase)
MAPISIRASADSRRKALGCLAKHFNQVARSQKRIRRVSGRSRESDRSARDLVSLKEEILDLLFVLFVYAFAEVSVADASEQTSLLA